MVAVSQKFPHETEEIFQVLCEALKMVSDARLEDLPGDIGETLENVLTSAFSDVCQVLASEQGDMLPFAQQNVDLAAGCLEAVRVFGRIDEDGYRSLRQMLLRAHDTLERMWKHELYHCRESDGEEDRPS